MRYAYYPDSNVSNITIWDEGNVSKDLYLLYAPDRTLWLAIWQEWDGVMPPASGLDIRGTDAWEFLYDSGRERYLARHWNVTQEPGQYPVFTAGDATWTDYLGPQPYVDYTIDEGEPSEVMRYLAGFGVHAQETVMGGTAGGTGGGTGVSPVNGTVRFLHGDLTRSTMMTTDTSASVVARLAYTAFGDPVAWDPQSETWRVGWCRQRVRTAGHGPAALWRAGCSRTSRRQTLGRRRPVFVATRGRGLEVERG